MIGTICLSASLLFCLVIAWNRLVKFCARRIDLTNAHVLITGASTGIGLELAKLFYRQGASLTLVARNVDRLQAARDELETSPRMSVGQSIYLLQLDMSSNLTTIESAVGQHLAVTKPVDILINNAGFAEFQPLSHLSHSTIDQLMQTNCVGAMHLTKLLLPQLLRRAEGKSLFPVEHRRVLFVSSPASQIGLYGCTGYGASKAALRLFAETLRGELEPYGPRVGIAYPPDTDTPGFVKENLNKPALTSLLCSTAGLSRPSCVARTIFDGILCGDLVISHGFIGHAISLASASLLLPISTSYLPSKPGRFNASKWLAFLLGCPFDSLAIALLRPIVIGHAIWAHLIVNSRAPAIALTNGRVNGEIKVE